MFPVTVYVKPTTITHYQSADDKDKYELTKSIITKNILGKGEYMSIETLMGQRDINDKGINSCTERKSWVERGSNTKQH